MNSDFILRLRQWFEYEQDAHAKTISSLLDLPNEKKQTKEFQKAVDLYAHIIGARWLWLHRMGHAENMPDNLFPTDVNVEHLTDITDKMNAAWDNYFTNLNETELNRTFEYSSTENLLYTNKVDEILTQLFGHSWYHRGQIAQIVRSLDGTPAETDFVYWTRSPETK